MVSTRTRRRNRSVKATFVPNIYARKITSHWGAIRHFTELLLKKASNSEIKAWIELVEEVKNSQEANNLESLEILCDLAEEKFF